MKIFTALHPIIEVLGYISFGIVVLFIVLAFFYMLFKDKSKALFPADKMPLLRPVPIPTKNRSVFMRLLIWLFESRKFELAENWFFKLGDGTELVLHKGFVFDGASIPRLFWFLLSPVGLLLLPGLLHDYGYKYDLIWKKEDDGQLTEYWKGAGQKHWDHFFRDVGRQVNGLALVDTVAWLALRLFGFFAWNGHRRDNAAPVKPII